MQRCRDGRGGQVLEEPVVDGFDEVVSLLVEGVDSSLDGGNLAVGCGGVAGLVFFMPKSEVSVVLALDEGSDGVVESGNGFALVPLGGPEHLGGGQLSQVLA